MRWTKARVEHIGTRSDRYPDAIDIDVEWTDEAVAATWPVQSRHCVGMSSGSLPS